METVVYDPVNEQSVPGLVPPSISFFDDPLAPDLPNDRALVTTRRALCRVVTVAAEAGARFQREADSTDPVAWMLAPRRLFGGVAALDACLARDHFYRALVLHGLSLGVDAEPGSLDMAVPDDDEPGPPLGRPRRGRSDGRRSAHMARLYTATIAFSGGGVMLQAFHASVASHPAEVVQRLRKRFGEDVVSLAEIRVGFSQAMPLVIALVPESVAEVIRSVAFDCSTPAARNFTVDIEQRIEA